MPATFHESNFKLPMLFQDLQTGEEEYVSTKDGGIFLYLVETVLVEGISILVFSKIAVLPTVSKQRDVITGGEEEMLLGTSRIWVEFVLGGLSIAATMPRCSSAKGPCTVLVADVTTSAPQTPSQSFSDNDRSLAWT